ncbi:hypothetical protein ACFLVS_03270 [Chloroflexota bacterium]
MISTVTTSTISTVTTTIGFGLAIGIVAVIALLVFLYTRELAAASEKSRHKYLAKYLDIGIVPLLIAFIVIASMKIMEI